jgi:hypothetical protein
MPTYRMELRWTPKGLDNIHIYGDRRQKALKRAEEYGVTGPGGGAILIYETGSGPDWMVEGDPASVEKLARLFRWYNFVEVNVVGPFLSKDELDRLVDDFARLKGSPPR